LPNCDLNDSSRNGEQNMNQDDVAVPRDIGTCMGSNSNSKNGNKENNITVKES